MSETTVVVTKEEIQEALNKSKVLIEYKDRLMEGFQWGDVSMDTYYTPCTMSMHYHIGERDLLMASASVYASGNTYRGRSTINHMHPMNDLAWRTIESANRIQWSLREIDKDCTMPTDQYRDVKKVLNVDLDEFGSYPWLDITIDDEIANKKAEIRKILDDDYKQECDTTGSEPLETVRDETLWEALKSPIIFVATLAAFFLAYHYFF